MAITAGSLEKYVEEYPEIQSTYFSNDPAVIAITLPAQSSHILFALTLMPVRARRS
jgi:hypothetical protein